MSPLSSSSHFVFKVRNFLKMNSSARLWREKKSRLFSIDWKRIAFSEILVFFHPILNSNSLYWNKTKAAAEEKNNIFSKNDSIPSRATLIQDILYKDIHVGNYKFQNVPLWSRYQRSHTVRSSVRHLKENMTFFQGLWGFGEVNVEISKMHGLVFQHENASKTWPRNWWIKNSITTTCSLSFSTCKVKISPM